MTESEELLFRQCKEFVDEQSGGEWDDDVIATDARNMMDFINKVRPARAKLNMEATPEVIAMLDGSATREDEAWKVAQLAVHIMVDDSIMSVGAIGAHVETARKLLAESRRQVATPAERDDG